MRSERYQLTPEEKAARSTGVPLFREAARGSGKVDAKDYQENDDLDNNAAQNAAVRLRRHSSASNSPSSLTSTLVRGTSTQLRSAVPQHVRRPRHSNAE
jgi:hypothetical protein